MIGTWDSIVWNPALPSKATVRAVGMEYVTANVVTELGSSVIEHSGQSPCCALDCWRLQGSAVYTCIYQDSVMLECLHRLFTLFKWMFVYCNRYPWHDTKLHISKTYVFVACGNSVYCVYLGSKYLFMCLRHTQRLVLPTLGHAKVSLISHQI